MSGSTGTGLRTAARARSITMLMITLFFFLNDHLLCLNS